MAERKINGRLVEGAGSGGGGVEGAGGFSKTRDIVRKSGHGFRQPTTPSTEIIDLRHQKTEQQPKSDGEG